MRHDDPRAEKRAWVLLRDRRMLGLKFRRQFPIANYIVDFYCEELKLIVELDGSVHDDPKQARNDGIRNTHLENLGYQVFVFLMGWFYRRQMSLSARLKDFCNLRNLELPGSSEIPHAALRATLSRRERGGLADLSFSLREKVARRAG